MRFRATNRANIRVVLDRRRARWEKLSLKSKIAKQVSIVGEDKILEMIVGWS
jgi:hypothetical protein